MTLTQTPVPNRFPKLSPTLHRIAIIGEAPGRDEEIAGEPFVGASGRLLKAYLSKAKINPDQCFFGNVCQIRPPANEIEAFSWEGEEIQSGLQQLKKDIYEFKPNLVLLLGKTALYSANRRSDITNMRGSLFHCDNADSPFLGQKCLATIHPAACLRVYEYLPLFGFDLRRAEEEASTSFLSLPKRDMFICRTVADVSKRLCEIQRRLSGTDIEGYVFDLQCIAFSVDPSQGFVIPIRGPDGGSFWKTEDEEVEVWRLLTSYLTDPSSPKVWQNGLYDRFVLQYGYQIPCQGNVHDTMLGWHELYCELPKSLDTQVSLLTREPYYKHERKTDSWETKMLYCVKDACCTLECHQKIFSRLEKTEPAKKHYFFNRDLLNPMLYMELKGIRYDIEKAQARRVATFQLLYDAQFALDNSTNRGIDNINLIDYIHDHLCTKKCPKDMEKFTDYAYSKYKEKMPRIVQLVKEYYFRRLTFPEKGELSTLLELHLNVDSPKFTKFLYTDLKLPVQINKATKQPTADYLALMRLWKKTKNEILKHAIDIRRHSQDAEMLGIHADPDGKIRCAYNAVGTETGRVTCYTSPTGSGYNLQTIQKKDRDLFMADADHWFFQCDLAGADGWTIGAWCKYLGDSTMYDDLVGGLKPAQAVCLLLRHGAGINAKPREELKAMAKSGIDKEGWEYFVCKQGIWGTCYTMGPQKLGDQIFKKSKGEVMLSEREVIDFQKLIYIRYHGVKLWQDYMQRRLSKIPTLTSASGLTRRFFGRKDEILGEALAHEPQNNTTYANNMAMLNLWNDKENRKRVSGQQQGFTETDNLQSRNCQLRVQPLHQVHDAICGQFRKDDTSWAVGRIKQYYNTPLQIANQTITIPFDGDYGPSWGELGEKHGGGKI